MIGNYIERFFRWLILFITNYLPVKVIRDDNGTPFLYRYHLFTFGNDGPGMCIHHFVKSDPDRGYHDHPWKNALSFILCGGYKERIFNRDAKSYKTYQRNRFTFNYLNGIDTFHRVMIEKDSDAWTLFAFRGRSKTWGMISLNGKYKPMSYTVSDTDGGWWNFVKNGKSIHQRIELDGKVISTVDIVVIADNKVLLIKRGKEPYKYCWAFPGGRIEPNDDDILSAAKRELKEETSLELDLKPILTKGNNTRDPRGFCVTNVFVSRLDEVPINVRAGDDAVGYKWFPLDDFSEIMAFDHHSILKEIIK